MEEKKWVETKKECDVGEDGALIVKTVTLEIEKPIIEKKQGFEKKDIIDLSLRVVGLMAIGIPVILFYFQQRAERDRQRASLQVDAYSNISMMLHELTENRELRNNKAGFESKRLRVLHEFTPKLALCTNDDSLVYLLEKVNVNLETYSAYRNFLDLSDSIIYLALDNISGTWNALARVSPNIPVDQLMVRTLAISQKSLANAVWNYRFSQAIESPIYDLFDSLIMAHQVLAETLYDFEQLTQEIISIEAREVGIRRLTLREKVSPECFRILEQVGRLPTALRFYRNCSSDYLPTVKNQLERLDRKFIESNRYLSD